LFNNFISENIRHETKQALKEGFEKLINKQSSDANDVLKVAYTIIDNILSQEEIIINISDIKSKDQFLFEHSINVCALSVIMGIHLGYSTPHLRELAIGSLLHDLGKLLTPKDILENIKSSELSSEEMETFKIAQEPAINWLKSNIDAKLVDDLLSTVKSGKVGGGRVAFASAASPTASPSSSAAPATTAPSDSKTEAPANNNTTLFIVLGVIAVLIVGFVLFRKNKKQ
jgi:LPXTG-motif cell wall-anchored protein